MDIPFEAWLLRSFSPSGNKLQVAGMISSQTYKYFTADATKAQWKSMFDLGKDKWDNFISSTKDDSTKVIESDHEPQRS